MDFETNYIRKYSDKRGFLIEFLKGSELVEGKRQFAQIYCATLKPNAVRGNHYHKTKDEWLMVITGKIKVTVEDISSGERKYVILDSNEKCISRVRIGRNIAHTIKNIANSIAVIVAYTTEEYDPKNLDQGEYKFR